MYQTSPDTTLDQVDSSEQTTTPLQQHIEHWATNGTTFDRTTHYNPSISPFQRIITTQAQIELWTTNGKLYEQPTNKLLNGDNPATLFFGKPVTPELCSKLRYGQRAGYELPQELRTVMEYFGYACHMYDKQRDPQVHKVVELGVQRNGDYHAPAYTRKGQYIPNAYLLFTLPHSTLESMAKAELRRGIHQRHE